MTLLLATDFDGTIADIRVDPAGARIADDVRELFADCLRRGGVAIAIISGRDLADLMGRTDGLALWRAGSHGLEVAAPDGQVIRSARVFEGEPPSRWLAAALSAGFRIETKKFGLALHWRGTDGLSSRHALVDELRIWARDQGLVAIEGRSVLEVRIAGPSKRDALELLAASTSASVVSYAGDDVTDHEALEWAGSRGTAFFVRSREHSSTTLRDVVSVVDRATLLDAWRKLVFDAGRQA
ncbi:MAG: trehalose-phosphatase [Acidobacteria bacterium]|nr:trehalose-phosphatase [Acidobacteriota bacterium]